MVLTHRAGRPLPRLAAAWCLALSAPLLLAACSLRYDESFDRGKRNGPRHGAGSVTVREDAGQPGECRDEPAANGPVIFGVRYDDRREKTRLARMGGPREVPSPLKPSVRELREARASLVMEEKIHARGGPTYVRNNGASSKPGEVRFVASHNALGMHIDASRRLNAVGGVPTAMVLVVYHLRDRLALDQLAQTEQGMRKLLEGEMFDPSVVAVREFFIQPGLHNKLELDRAEGGQYVAVVAGYNRPDARTSLHVASYNIGVSKKKAENKLMRDIDIFSPMPMDLFVELGEGSMLVAESAKNFHNLRESTKMQRRTQPFLRRL